MDEWKAIFAETTDSRSRADDMPAEGHTTDYGILRNPRFVKLGSLFPAQKSVGAFGASFHLLQTRFFNKRYATGLE